MPVITLPDGSTRKYAQPVTPFDVAADIGPGLAKAAMAARIGDQMIDLSRVLESDTALSLVTNKDGDSLDLIRHDAAHVMAEAVLELFPETHVTIVPSS